MLELEGNVKNIESQPSNVREVETERGLKVLGDLPTDSTLVTKPRI